MSNTQMVIFDVDCIYVNRVFPEITEIRLENGQHIDVNSEEFDISFDRESRKNCYRVTVTKIDDSEKEMIIGIDKEHPPTMAE